MSILVIDVGTSGVRAAVVHPDATVSHETHRARLPPTPDARPRRVRRPAYADAALEAPGRPSKRRSGRGRRGRQPAGVHGRVGPRHRRAGRARRRAGRTCAPSATASCCRPRVSGWRPTSRPPSSRTCSTVRPRPQPRPVLRHARLVDGLALSEGEPTSPTSPTPPSPGSAQRRRQRLDEACWRRCASPRCCPGRRLHRRRRRGDRPPRRAADRRHRRRPAGIVDRPGCVRPGWPRSPSAPAGCSTSGRPERPTFATRGPAARSPSCAGATDGRHLGHRGDHALGRHQRGVAARRPRAHRRRGRAPTSRRACDDTGRRGLRARPARPRHPPVGLRRPGRAARDHPRHGRAQIVRAVLEGVAHRGADLVEAAEADAGTPSRSLRIDGGMSANPTFVQALADAAQQAGRGVTGARGHHVGRRPSSPGWCSSPAAVAGPRPGATTETAPPAAAPFSPSPKVAIPTPAPPTSRSTTSATSRNRSRSRPAIRSPG
jgi:glycerol kinase